MTKSKVEITATDADGRIFIGVGEVVWNATRVDYSHEPFKPSAIHEWKVLQDDGSVIGWLPIPLKENDDDETEA